MTNHPNRNETPNMKRWTNEKLEKELSFARAAGDADWLYACEVEADRRSRMSEIH